MKQGFEILNKKQQIGFSLFLFLASAFPCFAAAPAYPQWWSNRNVVVSSAVTNDFCFLNAGQLRWLVTKAREEVNARVPDGAGVEITDYVQHFVNDNNYAFVSRGQLKYAASLFYNRFSELRGSSPVSLSSGAMALYPWPMRSLDANDTLPANVGQAKYLFNFQWNSQAGRWQHEFLDISTPQVANNTAIFVFSSIANRPWDSGQNTVLSFSDCVYTDAEFGWARYYLCSSSDGGGWNSVGLTFGVSWQTYAITSDDSVDITPAADMGAFYGVDLLHTGGNIYLNKPVYLVKWNPGNLIFSVNRIENGKAYLTITLEGYSQPPHNGSWSRDVYIQTANPAAGWDDSFTTVNKVTFNEYTLSIDTDIPISGTGTVIIRLATTGNVELNNFSERTRTSLVLASISLEAVWREQCIHFPDSGQQAGGEVKVTVSPASAPGGNLKIMDSTLASNVLYEGSVGPGTHTLPLQSFGTETLNVIWTSTNQTIETGVSWDYRHCWEDHPELTLVVSEPDSDRQSDSGNRTLATMNGSLVGTKMRVDPKYTVRLSSSCPDVQLSPASFPCTETSFERVFSITVADSFVPQGVVTIIAELYENNEPAAYPIYATSQLDSFVDVDVDSDNLHGFDEPPQKDDEDNAEISSPGKIIICNDGDVNENEVIDYADGYDWDKEDDKDDAALGVQFVPLVINLPNSMDAAAAKISISTEGRQSNPTGIVEQVSGELVPAAGVLRIWKKNGTEVRDGRSVADGGDWVANDVYSDLAGLGFQGTRCVLYLEGVNAGEVIITVRMGPNAVDAPLPWSDQVIVTVLKPDLAIIDREGGEVSEKLEETVGEVLPVNIDDDDNIAVGPNPVPDKDRNGIVHEDDLLAMVLHQSVPAVAGSVYRISFSDKIAIWKSPTKYADDQVFSDETEFPVNSDTTVYVEGLTPSSDNSGEIISLQLIAGGNMVAEDKVKIIVPQMIFAVFANFPTRGSETVLRQYLEGGGVAKKTKNNMIMTDPYIVKDPNSKDATWFSVHIWKSQKLCQMALAAINGYVVIDGHSYFGAGLAFEGVALPDTFALMNTSEPFVRGYNNFHVETIYPFQYANDPDTPEVNDCWTWDEQISGTLDDYPVERWNSAKPATPGAIKTSSVAALGGGIVIYSGGSGKMPTKGWKTLFLNMCWTGRYYYNIYNHGVLFYSCGFVDNPRSTRVFVNQIVSEHGSDNDYILKKIRSTGNSFDYHQF